MLKEQSDHHELLEEFRPLNQYAFSKHQFDIWVKYQKLLDQVVGLKYFNVYGPNEAHKGSMISMIYKMYYQILEKGKVRLFKSNDPNQFADGDQCRDFIYVKDAARMTCEFLENSTCGIFNIGTGIAGTWNQLAHATFKAMGKEPKIEYVDTPPALAKQYQNYTCADMNKYKEKKGLDKKKSPCDYSLEDGVLDYVQNHIMKDERW